MITGFYQGLEQYLVHSEPYIGGKDFTIMTMRNITTMTLDFRL